MSEVQRYPVPADLAATAQINAERYEALYTESIEDPEGFFDRQAKTQLTWMNDQWDRVSEVNMARGEVKWFAGGTLNACVNCIDRHLPERASQTAILWEGDDPEDSRAISYQEAYEAICRLANALKTRGVKKGDRVCIYMPMIPEAAFAMLACARIGAIHSVVFGGFSPSPSRIAS